MQLPGFAHLNTGDCYSYRAWEALCAQFITASVDDGRIQSQPFVGRKAKAEGLSGMTLGKKDDAPLDRLQSVFMGPYSHYLPNKGTFG